jgi:hypothetical protein
MLEWAVTFALLRRYLLDGINPEEHGVPSNAKLVMITSDRLDRYKVTPSKLTFAHINPIRCCCFYCVRKLFVCLSEALASAFVIDIACVTCD